MMDMEAIDLNSIKKVLIVLLGTDGHWYIMLEPQFDSDVDFCLARFMVKFLVIKMHQGKNGINLSFLI